MARRPPPQELIDAVARLIIHRHGRKALKDADLARLLGITPQYLYKQLAANLWLLSRNLMFQLTHEERSSRRQPFRSSLAFTQGGVMAIGGLLNNEHAFEVSIDIARILKQRRRSKRVSRRASDPARAVHYDAVYARLHAEWNKLRDKPRW